MASFVAFYMGSYEKHTRDLSMLEDGAYMRLLRYVWSTGNPIETASAYAAEDTNAYAIAYRIAYATDDIEREAVKKVLNKYFIFNKSEWIHERATIEHEKACRKSKANSKNAKKRWGNDAIAYANVDAIAYANVDAIAYANVDANNVPLHMPSHKMMPSHIPSHMRSLCNLDLESSNIDLINKYTHTLREAEPLENMDESVSEFENSSDEPITISLKVIDDVSPVMISVETENETSPPEQKTDLDLAARAGLQYAADSQNPNFQQMGWIEGFLKIQIPLIQAERPEITLSEIERLWRDTIDVMATKATGNPQYAKTTFSRKIDDWTPKQKSTTPKAHTDRSGTTMYAGEGAIRWWNEGKTLGHTLKNVSFTPEQLEWNESEKAFSIKGTSAFVKPESLRIAAHYDTPFDLGLIT